MLRRPASQAGTTIVESLAVLAIVGVLASMAWPSLAQHWRKTRRMDAVVAASRVQQAQERYRAERPGYADAFITQDGQAGGALVRMADAGESGRLSALLSMNGHYLLRVEAADPRGFRLVATARGLQADDRKCSSMSLTLDGDAVVYASSADGSTLDSEATHRCWAR